MISPKTNKKIYQIYHKHTSYSNVYTKDSPLIPLDYWERFKEEGGRHIYCTMEHGYQSPYYRIYDELEQYNKANNTDIKFVFGAEIYWVKNRFDKDSANCHMVLLAKNDKGRKAINKAISIANKTGYYYRPRLDLDLILSLPKDDVFVTSACIAFWNKYDDIDDIVIKLNEHFTDFYLEIQCHNTPKQITWNKHILELHKIHNIPLIAGTDTHILTETHIADRDDLLKSAKISYDDEEGWFIDYPDYDTFVQRFEEQNIFTTEQIIAAIENTNLILDFEDIILDRTMKLPTLYPDLTQDEKDAIFIETLAELWHEESTKIAPEKHPIYKKEIMKEIDEILGCHMCDYFLFNKKVIELGINKYGGELTQSGRGCFTEDALVHTKDTIKSIKDISIGDYVVTKDGKFNKVVDTMSYEIEEEMVKITHLYGTDTHYPTVCTKDHKIYINREGNLQWVAAQDVKNTDYVCVPKIKVDKTDYISNVIDLHDYNIFGYDYDDEYIYEVNATLGKEYPYSPRSVARELGISSTLMDDFADISCTKKLFSRKPEYLDKIMNYIPFNTREEYCEYVKSMKVKKIKRFINVDEEFNVFLGLMYGDGFTITKGIGLAINNSTEKDNYNRTIFNNIANRLNLTVSENRAKNRKLSQLYIHSKLIRFMFEEIIFVSKKNTEKQFNNRWFNQDVNNLKGIIKGLRYSDGNFGEDNRVSFDNTSKSLINAYKLLCLMTGEGVNSLAVRKCKIDSRGYHNKESYKLRLKTDKKPHRARKYNYFEDESYYYLPVWNIEILPKHKTIVYDITVENEHNYLLNNMIVHNSNVAMYLNKLLGFTNIDRIAAPIHMYPERFLTKERVLDSKTPPDEDFNVSAREPFMLAQKELLGETGCYDLVAFGTLHLKSAFKMYARANDVEPQIANDVSKQIEKYEKAMLYADEDEKDDIDVYDYVDKEKFAYIIEGCQRYLGIIDNRKGHPCGSCVSSLDLEEEIGIILCKSETTGKEVLTALIESITIDAFGWLKNDFLIVDSTRIINAVYRRIGIKPIEINDLLEMIKTDHKVWDIYAKGLTQCVNQIEKEKTTQKVMKFKPKNIVELTQFIAGIRPSFKSLYSYLESRTRYTYGIKALDNILQNEYCDSSFILFQEDLMRILAFAGFPMKDTYTIIKAISKKKKKKIDKVKPQFLANFAQRVLDSGDTDNHEEAKILADKIWGVVEDFASYGFNSPHGFSYAIDSVTQAWQKANYPYEFYEIVLQRFTEKGEKDKVGLIKQEMKHFGIKLKPMKFRDDNRNFTAYKEAGYITQPLNSIKNISKNAPDVLYEMRDIEVDSFTDLLIYMTENTGLNKTTITILIKLDYFSEFGNINQLLAIYEHFQGRYKKTYVEKTKAARRLEVLQFEEECDIDTHILDIVKYQIECMGYTNYKNPEWDINTVIVTAVERNTYGTPFVNLYNFNKGTSAKIKVNKFYFNQRELKVADIIQIIDLKNQKKTWITDREEYEFVLNSYRKVVTEQNG